MQRSYHMLISGDDGLEEARPLQSKSSPERGVRISRLRSPAARADVGNGTGGNWSGRSGAQLVFILHAIQHLLEDEVRQEDQIYYSLALYLGL